MRVAFLGNFSVPYSSESHEAASFEAIGCTVLRLQEGEVRATDVVRLAQEFDANLFFWVQTYGLAVTGGTDEERAQMLADFRAIGIPSVGYHLDLWHQLGRVEQLQADPYFRVDHFFSTDGAHDPEWKALGVNHYWLPPAVYHAEAYDGTPDPRFTSDVAFVGSWRHYGHAEHWPVRQQMLKALTRRYGRKARFWPQSRAVRGTELTDLYASVKVVVGDSCLAGHIPGYWSDRVAETTGRGGFLIHPFVEGIQHVHPNLITFTPGNWSEMCQKIDFYLRHDSDRELNRKQNAEWTRQNHTYKHRMQTILEQVGLS